MLERVKKMKKVLLKYKNFQIVIHQFHLNIGQNVLFEMLKQFYIYTYNINYLNCKW